MGEAASPWTLTGCTSDLAQCLQQEQRARLDKAKQAEIS
jgi:hypothetical protein